MAQAARLNLRLQKELKLLLTDPPPGAAFPLLSSSSSSLTAIDAQIKGPEGTVYAEGVFNIKIQIPERYPFQPPNVNFSTPIYHPNIDNGGRICLDILNLPPKGAWQPSLNISTVLTSIGLLLSEPNPDDGLMCEASREFKYNRQVFDQKARSMTQKYAQPAATGNVCDTQFHDLANPITVQPEVGTTTHESKHEADESVLSSHKVIGGSRKLSLQSSGQTQKRDVYVEGNQLPKERHFLADFGNQIEVEGTENVLKDTFEKCNQSREKLCGNRRKLSLESVGQFQKRSDNNMESVVSNHCPSVELENIPVPSAGSLVLQSGNSYKQGDQSQYSKLIDDDIGMRSKRQFGSKQSLGSLKKSLMINESNGEMLVTPQLSASQSHSNALYERLPVAPAPESVKGQPHKDLIDGAGNGSTGTSCKRLCLAGKKLSLGFRGSSETHGKAEKENVVPQVTENCDGGSMSGDVNVSYTKCGKAQSQERNSKNMLPQSRSVSSYPSNSHPTQKQNLRWNEKQQCDQNDNFDNTGTIKKKEAEGSAIPEPEAVIVLDSESSDEDRSRPLMSKSLLARKRMGKWRVRT